MSEDQQRADDRERFLLLSTLRLPSGEQRVKVRDLSPSGAQIDGIRFASAGDHGGMDIRNVGDVGFSVVWASEGRAGLKFDRTIDPNLVRSISANTQPQQELVTTCAKPLNPLRRAAGPFYTVRWMKGTELVSETRFEQLLVAKAHAKERFSINRIRKGITAAEVSDIEGVAYFHIES